MSVISLFWHDKWNGFQVSPSSHHHFSPLECKVQIQTASHGKCRAVNFAQVQHMHTHTFQIRVFLSSLTVSQVDTHTVQNWADKSPWSYVASTYSGRSTLTNCIIAITDCIPSWFSDLMWFPAGRWKRYMSSLIWERQFRMSSFCT